MPHVPPLEESFGTWLGWVVDPDRPIVLLLDSPDDWDSAIRQIVRIGCESTVLGDLDDGLDAWLRAGEALEHVFLEIARFGYATSPVMQALELPETRRELRRELGLTYWPQFLFRVGKARSSTAPTPRRALEDLLVEDHASGA